jgi:hypothetical protein
MIKSEDLAGLFLAHNERICDAISTGAGWEVWMQVELVLLFRSQEFQAAREIFYSKKGRDEPRLDVLARDRDGAYAIELKVESANNSGSIMDSVVQDMDKIKGFTFTSDFPITRWVVAIAYSVKGKRELADFVTNDLIIYRSNTEGSTEIEGIGSDTERDFQDYKDKTSIISATGGIGVLVATVVP